MKTNLLFRLAAVVIGMALIGGGIAVQAQEEAASTDDLALAVANAQKANQAAIAKYSWSAKADLAMEGEPKATSISAMRFNSEGKLEVTQTGGESYTEKKKGLRGRRQEKKMEDFAEYLQGVLEHSFHYIFLSKGTLVDVFDRAKVTESESSIDISAGDLFVKADELFMSVDPATHMPQKVTFKTTLGEDTIQGSVVMKTVENGPCTPAHLEIDVTNKAIKITSETYDWVAQK